MDGRFGIHEEMIGMWLLNYTWLGTVFMAEGHSRDCGIERMDSVVHNGSISGGCRSNPDSTSQRIKSR